MTIMEEKYITYSQLPDVDGLDGTELFSILTAKANGKVLLSAIKSFVLAEITKSVQDNASSISTLSRDKQDALVSGENISTINGQSLLDGGDIQIEAEASSDSSAGLKGMLNLTDIEAVKTAMSDIEENEVRFFVIADSEGKIPSKHKCYDVPVEVVRQISLTTGNSIVDAILNAVSVDSFGVSVGDLIALTRVSVKLSDLAEALGVEITLSGSMLINQYKVLHTNGTREEYYEEGCTKGVYGLLSPYNKKMIDDGVRKTRYGYHTPLDQCLKTGCNNYTNTTIDGILGNWTIFVDCTADTDEGGYYHIIQTAVCRESGSNLGHMWKRFGFYQEGKVPTFYAWRKITD